MGVYKGKSSGGSFTRTLVTAAAFFTSAAAACSLTVARLADVDSLFSLLTSCKDIHVSWQGHFVVKTTISVLEGVSLTVVGSSAATADGAGTVQLFKSSGALHLESLHLTGGYAIQGGAVQIKKGAASFSNCNFTNNTAENYGEGGGISIIGGIVTVNGSSFTSNTADEGGGVYNIGGTVTVNGSSFTNNTATYGGGIKIHKYGGGVKIDGGNIMVSNCSFSSNTADYGGAVFVYGGTATMKMCNFTSNTAPLHGGGVYIDGASVTVDGSSFTNNTADSGGGVYVYAGVYIDGANVTVDSSSFTNNTALYYGGGVNIDGANVTVDGSSFTNNTAEKGGGGGLYNTGISTITACTFTANVATAASGGAVNSELATRDMTVTDCTFVENKAAVDGGALIGIANRYAYSNNLSVTPVTPMTSVIGCNFTSNAASRYGGAVNGLSLNLIGGRFEQNHAQAGGAIWGVIVSAAKSYFTGNKATTGGAIYSELQADLTRSIITNNSARDAGGGVFTIGISSWVAQPDSTFSGNIAGCCYNPSNSTNPKCSDVDWQSRASASCCVSGEWVNTPSCTLCPDGFDCSGVGLVVNSTPLSQGFWRGSINSKESRVCLNEAACKGGLATTNTSLNDYCSSGYSGPLCAVCASNYASGVAYDCHECSHSSVIASVCFIVLLALLVIGVVWYVATDLHGDGSRPFSPHERTGTPRRLWSKIRAAPFGKLRAPIVVLQIVTQYAAITGTMYPKVYQNFLNVAAAVGVNITVTASLGCVFSISFYDYLMFVTIVPLVVMAMLALSLALVRFRVDRYAAAVGPRFATAGEGAPESRWDRAVGRHSLVFLVFTFLIYSTTSTAVFQTFACDDLSNVSGGPAHYLRADYSVECYTPRHRGFRVYAGFMVLVYPVGIPLIYAWMLWQRRSLIVVVGKDEPKNVPDPRLSDLSIRPTRFLWQPYKPSVFWWELAECVRRLFLTGFLVFIQPGTIGQTEWACVFSVVSLAAVFYFLPHKDVMDAHVYSLGCIIIFCSMFLSVVIEAETSFSATQNKQAVAVLLVVLNVLLVLASLAQCFYIACRGTASLEDVSFFGLLESSRKEDGMAVRGNKADTNDTGESGASFSDGAPAR